ncbi:MAG TPA: ABC transporter substrate-binding protein [Candidatus Cloacimonadota bacterium]|mgnify:FL=1|nr:ABC transporter substrate-binding protein [Candidatus Cloacimonadota bacterium]
MKNYLTKNFAFVILAAIAIILSVNQCKSHQKQHDLRQIKVVLDWTPNTNHTGLYVALDKGFFKEEGLDVTIIQPGQNSSEQIVASGNAQFGVSYQESVIHACIQDIPLVSLAAIIQHNTSGFASLKSMNITRPKDFEGKRYGSSGWPTELEIVRSVMQADSAKYENVQVLQGVTDFFSTIGKDADFEWIYWGWDGVEAQRRGIELNYIPVKDLNPVFDYYTPVLITNQKAIDADPELVKGFMRAVAKGYNFAIEKPKEAADILMKQVPELATNKEQIYRSLDYLKHEFTSDAAYWGEQKYEVWQNFIDWLYNKRIIMTGVKADKMFTNDFLPR